MEPTPCLICLIFAWINRPNLISRSDASFKAKRTSIGMTSLGIKSASTLCSRLRKLQHNRYCRMKTEFRWKRLKSWSWGEIRYTFPNFVPSIFMHEKSEGCRASLKLFRFDWHKIYEKMCDPKKAILKIDEKSEGFQLSLKVFRFDWRKSDMNKFYDLKQNRKRSWP